jgi:hypothetical protein
MEGIIEQMKKTIEQMEQMKSINLNNFEQKIMPQE